MGSNILGISCFYHDAAAALLRDGVLVAAAEEERFSRDAAVWGPQQKLGAFFSDRHIAYVDASEHLSASGLSPSAVFFPDDPDHFTPAGHKIIADLILERER